MKRLSILGSTGSIGKSTIDVVLRNPDKFEVVALAEGHDVGLLYAQIKSCRPKLVSVRDEASAEKLRALGSVDCKIVHGIEGACEVARHADANLVVSAMVGSIGLKPTCEAIKAGKNIALANKETLVAAGPVVNALLKKHKVEMIPIDSEHSALFQSIVGHNKGEISRLILTASGGPFRGFDRARLENVTLEDALKHPNWSMGAKITIDSASMMNKGLEVIEARWLFDVPVQKIDVVIHPQSVIHSMVEYIDGAVMAQLANPDMRGPIAYALAYPDRVPSGIEPLDLAKISKLTFEAPDKKTFKCLQLAYEAADVAESMPCVLNAANEVAVAAFLAKKIRFLDIPRVVEEVMNSHRVEHLETLEQVFALDAWARKAAEGKL